jgi:hypothetical protein
MHAAWVVRAILEIMDEFELTLLRVELNIPHVRYFVQTLTPVTSLHVVTSHKDIRYVGYDSFLVLLKGGFQARRYGEACVF